MASKNSNYGGFDPYQYLSANPAAAAMIGRGQTTALGHWEAAGRPAMPAPPAPAGPQPGVPTGANSGTAPNMAPALPIDAYRFLEEAAAGAAGKRGKRRGGAAALLAPQGVAQGAPAMPMNAGQRASAARMLLLGQVAP